MPRELAKLNVVHPDPQHHVGRAERVDAGEVAGLSTQHDQLAAQVAQLQADMNLVKAALGIP